MNRHDGRMVAAPQVGGTLNMVDGSGARTRIRVRYVCVDPDGVFHVHADGTDTVFRIDGSGRGGPGLWTVERTLPSGPLTFPNDEPERDACRMCAMASLLEFPDVGEV